MGRCSSTSRTLTVAAAQLGPVARHASRAQTVARMIDLLRQAHARQAGLVVFLSYTLLAVL